MDFALNQDQTMLVDSLSRYLAEQYPIATRNRISDSEEGWSQQHWRELADLGIVGALFGEGAGGYGGSPFDVAAVFEQLGRALVVEPFLGTLMAGRILAAAGSQTDLIAQIIAGETIVAFAHEEPASQGDAAGVSARASDAHGAGWTLTGAKAVVRQIGAADQLLCSARISGEPGDLDGIGLFLVAKAGSGISTRTYGVIDGGRAGELLLDAAPATLVAADGGALIEDALAWGLAALCWEAVGLMEVIKTSTLEYMRTRQQFGAPIGKFQALQHRMATVALEIEQARSAAINASAALDAEAGERDRAASAGKFTIGRVGALVGEEAIQMHGGMGMTWEMPISHYAKRLIMIDHQLGDEDHHLQRYVELA